MKTRVLFVCMGNICRSPAAEGVLRHQVEAAGLASKVEVASAGTIGMHAGEMPDPRMRQTASKRGYRLESRARKFRAEDFTKHDLILTMDEANRREVLKLATTEEERAKVRSFCSYCRQHSEKEVPDPYYGGQAGFEKVLDLLEDGCATLVESLR